MSVSDVEKQKIRTAAAKTGPLRPGGPGGPGRPHSVFSTSRRRLALTIVTVAGFFGPLAAGIYLPALPILQREFSTSTTTINATVSVFMVVLAVAVC
jgi:uncharacterized membrane protein YidH (DUF202 family)